MKQELENIKVAVGLATQMLNSQKVSNIDHYDLINDQLKIAVDNIDNILTDMSKKAKQPSPADNEPVVAKLPLWRKIKNKIWSD